MRCPPNFPNYYILHWARQNIDEIVAHANGTTFLEISKINFRPLKVLVPESAILRTFSTVVKPLYDQMVCNLKQSYTLATLRDALLPKLLSGEVSVDTALAVAEGA